MANTTGMPDITTIAYNATTAFINSTLQNAGTDPTTPDTNYTGSPITGSTSTSIAMENIVTRHAVLHDDHYLGDNFNSFILVLNCLIAVTAIPLNLAVMGFCRTRLNDTVPFLYFTLSTSDLVTSISAALHAIIFGYLLILGPGGEEGAEGLFYLGVVGYFFVIVSFRVSAFVSLTFAVIRTIKIVFCFVVIRRRVVLAVILVYSLVCLAVFAVELWTFWKIAKGQGLGDRTKWSKEMSGFFTGYFYSPTNVKIVESLYNDMDDQSKREFAKCGISLLYTGLTISFPAFLALLAMIVQLVYLARAPCTTNQAETRQVSVTIILVTFVFVLCATAMLFQPVLHDCTDGLIKLNMIEKAQLTYFFGYVPFFINAALNPLILVFRVKGLKTYLSGLKSYALTGEDSSTAGRGSSMGRTALTSTRSQNSLQRNSLQRNSRSYSVVVTHDTKL